MYQKYSEQSKIFSEMDKIARDQFFQYEGKRFLHNIDTFYYSIKLKEDFRRESEDHKVKLFREWRDRIRADSIVEEEKSLRDVIPGLESCTVVSRHFSKYYDICISKERMFDAFIASVVPSDAEGGESVTPEIIVQLRSDFLWAHSITDCFEISLDYILRFVQHFDLTVKEVQENRVDFCYHSNYIANPEKYFDKRSLHQRAVTRIHQGYMHWEDNADGYDIDYVAYGKRSNKIFLRIYNKTKEVVEMGYKGWFLKLWQLQGLISRYDYYVYEKAYKDKDWKSVDIYRLEFYLDYGTDPELRQLCEELLAAENKDRVKIKKLANKLTPKVTMIMNVEYQVMRRATKSMELLPVKDRRSEYACERVYKFLDNWHYITEYLTYDVFRLCNNDNENISRRSINDFWQRLRSCPIYDGSAREDHQKIIRNYKRQLDVNSMKERFISSAISLGLYTKSLNCDSIIRDCMDGISILNDNDIMRARKKKIKRMKVFDAEDLEKTQKVINAMIDGSWMDTGLWGVDGWLEKIMNGVDPAEWEDSA